MVRVSKNFQRPLWSHVHWMTEQLSNIPTVGLPLHHRTPLHFTKMASTEAVPVPFFKKKRARPATTRQRTPSPPASDPTAAASASSSKSQVVLPSKKAGGNLLSAGTKRTSSQRRAGDLDEDEIDEGTRDGPGINWTSTGGHVNKVLEILEGDEAEEMLAKRAKKDDAAEDDTPDDGLYHGQKSYKSHIKKSQEIPKSMRTGPVRSNNSTIRTVTIVDYQPDVCKDYKGADRKSVV